MTIEDCKEGQVVAMHAGPAVAHDDLEIDWESARHSAGGGR